jgi:hypothetical protein
MKALAHTVNTGVELIGTHLEPLQLFGELFGREEDPMEVIARISVPTTGRETIVLVTRASGLFVERPRDDRPIEDQARLAFVQEAVDAFNLLICELNLVGVVSLPASTAEVGRAELVGNSVHLGAAAGAYQRRSLPRALVHGARASDFVVAVDPRYLGEVDGVPCARQLVDIAYPLPQLVSAAYGFYSRRLLAEALINAWMSTEQILSRHLWKAKYTSLARDPAHEQRLRDHRTFSASVMSEILLTCEAITGDEYDMVQKSRKARNDLVHEGKVNTLGTDAAMEAMRMMIEKVCGRPVAKAHAMVEVVPW